ncbi:c-type cytochrome [Pseudothauera nasutitermitis]|uniref:C-type cytochrome n=2 Tax=Pseudothauera nasutitermitis TaxID=2565930 RepID=A0A4S4B0F2_9RHOO|nr:c-type cytochrome [Pseudothauera nasutitermitis]
MTAMSCCGIASAGQDTAMAQARSIADTFCVTCHGSNGVSVVDHYPSLAGQKAAYLEKQMNAFRDGTRQDDIMMNMVTALDAPVIKALADYYASQKLP